MNTFFFISVCNRGWNKSRKWEEWLTIFFYSCAKKYDRRYVQHTVCILRKIYEWKYIVMSGKHFHNYHVIHTSQVWSLPTTSSQTQRCGQVMKSPFKGGQGMSANDKACYDKLDKAIVPLSRLDDCAQSTSLKTFFSSSLGQGFSHILSEQVLGSHWHLDPQLHITLHSHRSHAPPPLSLSKA